jgi:GTP-binding protein LepA
MENLNNIRNFCIIAHIDHGKSTLADRFLELSDLSYKVKESQVLDSMDLERERGITIKAHPIRLEYNFNGETYIFNLIDTPGHVDFSYEVSRSLAACEGAILLVDASQGVEAQTVANTYLAMEHNLTIIPVVNKIDLKGADIEGTKKQITDLLGMNENEIYLVSAKTGEGVKELLQAVKEKIPPPEKEREEKLKALIFDSHYDTYKGVIVHIRVFEGVIKKGMKIMFMSNREEYTVEEIGIFKLGLQQKEELSAGEVGYFTAVIRDAHNVRVGDTITEANNPTRESYPGYRKAMPFVYSGLYPINPNEYDKLKDSLEKLRLNDSSFIFEPETSAALGYGFRCGFLGLLHMEIISERLKREYEQEIIMTSPSVIYRITLNNDEILMIENPSKFPDRSKVKKIEEPYVKASIIAPPDYIGPIMELAKTKRATFKNMEYLSESRVMLHYEFPLSEIITEFYDKLKSATKGYGSLDYEFIGFKEENIVLVDILINGQKVDALSFMSVEEEAYKKAKNLIEKLRKLIPRQLFQVALQAAIGGKIIARENVVPLRKDVLAKCYGGDITRKRKLLEKQKEGKKRMKAIGNVEIPQEAFLSLLKTD